MARWVKRVFETGKKEAYSPGGNRCPLPTLLLVRAPRMLNGRMALWNPDRSLSRYF